MDAYVTLLSTESFLEAVLVLNQSLKNVNSEYPLVCMVTNNLNEKITKILESQNIIVEIVPNIEYSEKLQKLVLTEMPQVAHTLNTGSKFCVFTLPKTKYNKIVYIDVDVIVLQNMDDIMNYPDGSMLYINGENLSGMFVIELKNHSEYEVYECLLKYGCFNDGTVLGQLWFFVRTNTDYQIPSLFQQLYRVGDINTISTKSFHFQGPFKPWIHLDKYNKYCPVFQLYTYYLDNVRQIISKY